MYTLLTPGPVPLHPSVKDALQRPLLHHRTPEFEAIFKNLIQKLPMIYQTQQHCCVLSCTGTGVMEAALVNVFAPGQSVLSVCAGKFGERWADMAETFGLKVTRFDTPWGQDVDLKKLESLIKVQQFDGVLIQACETSTGARLPVEQIAQLFKSQSPKTLLCVDAITALGAYSLPMDDLKLDVVIGGSQKGLMAPTGLGLIALSERAWEICERGPTLPRYYWDLKSEKTSNKKDQTRFSSAVTLLTALNESVEIFLKYGINTFFARTEKLAAATRAGFGVYGFHLFPQSPSPSLSCLRVPKGVSALRMRAELEKEFQITIMAGQDRLQDEVVRIGHMGYIRNDDILSLIKCVGEWLAQEHPQIVTEAQIETALTSAKSQLGADIP